MPGVGDRDQALRPSADHGVIPRRHRQQEELRGQPHPAPRGIADIGAQRSSASGSQQSRQDVRADDVLESQREAAYAAGKQRCASGTGDVPHCRAMNSPASAKLAMVKRRFAARSALSLRRANGVARMAVVS